MDNFSEFERPIAPQKESGSIISHAWENYKGIFIYALLYVVLASLIGFVISLFLPNGNSELYKEIAENVSNGRSIDFEEVIAAQSSAGIGSSVLNIIISSVFGALLYPLSAGVIYIAHKFNSKQNIETTDLFIGYKQNTVNLMVYGLMMSVITTVGFYLCVLPGIYFAVVSMIGLPIIFFENQTPIETLKKSIQITNSDFGTFLGVGILTFLIAISGVLLCCVGVFLTAGFFYSAQYSTYCAYCGTPYELNKE